MTITFSPLPLASVVGLGRAAAALDDFYPHANSELHHQRLMAAVYQAGRDRVQGRRREDVPVYAPDRDLRSLLAEQGDVEGVAQLDVASELWHEHRDDVVKRALIADRERVQWQARRRVNTSREARRQVTAWSRQADELGPIAVGVADRTARTINDAAAGVASTFTSTTNTPGGFARWH